MHTFESTASRSRAEEAGPSERQALSGRGWKRVAIIASAAAVLMGGVTIFATQSGATEPQPVQRDRLVQFEHMGCKLIEAFPKHGWICIER